MFTQQQVTNTPKVYESRATVEPGRKEFDSRRRVFAARVYPPRFSANKRCALQTYVDSCLRWLSLLTNRGITLLNNEANAKQFPVKGIAARIVSGTA